MVKRWIGVSLVDAPAAVGRGDYNVLRIYEIQMLNNLSGLVEVYQQSTACTWSLLIMT